MHDLSSGTQNLQSKQDASCAPSLAVLDKIRGNRSFVIHGLEWSSYRKISEALDERHFRLAYDGWNLELKKLSSSETIPSRLMGHLVAVMTEEMELPISSCGDMTCEREDLEVAIEPDESFYITNESAVRKRERIDLALDPPPDLAVQLDLGYSSINRLEILAKIGIPEAWSYDGETVRILRLSSEGTYTEAERSMYFTFVTGADLARFLSQRTQMDETSLIRSFREWVKEKIR